MSKKNTHTEKDLLDLEAEEVYSRTEHFIEDNKKILVGIIGGVLLIVAAVFAYKSLYIAPLEEEAKAEIFMAERYFAQDSLNKAVYGDGVYLGFVGIIDEYGATKTGNLAQYYLGISFLRMGQYQQAISALNDFSSDDKIVSTIAKGAIGDAYMELGDIEKAASYYEEAAHTNENEFTTPIYLLKAAKAEESMGNYENALSYYQEIKKEYKTTPEGSDIEKYIARAEAYIK